jgi:hypothetical protein
MPLSEFLKSPFGASDALSHSGFEDVEIIDNTSDDITVAVDEMENLLSSVEKTIPETPAQKLLMEVRQNLSRPERSLLSRSFMDTHSYLFA